MYAQMNVSNQQKCASLSLNFDGRYPRQVNDSVL